MHTGKNIQTLKCHAYWVESVAFSPDGKTIASGYRDDTICLWDVNTGQNIQTLKGHTYWVESVAFSPEGKTLASGSSDGTVLLWNITPLQLPEDVNADGIVDILDLTMVASEFGEQVQNTADVNGDGVVNILDLVQVAAAFGNTVSDQ